MLRALQLARPSARASLAFARARACVPLPLPRAAAAAFASTARLPSAPAATASAAAAAWHAASAQSACAARGGIAGARRGGGSLFAALSRAAGYSPSLPRAARRALSTLAAALPLPPPGSLAAGAGADAALEAGASSSSSSARDRRAVGLWLLGMAGMVFAMVVLGGATRLTRSGLSIVEWRLRGEPLPRDAASWERAFAAYRAFPEFQKVNSRMTLPEFQFIYFMEWLHRAWGRAIGVAFTAPLLYFALARRIPAGLAPRLALMLGLGATQGGVGWWMVKSGLEHERFRDTYAVPRVSPYRLATHLTFAFTVYSLLVWTSLDLLAAPVAAASLSAASVAATRRLRPFAALFGALVATTAFSGAFVAGNDAGRAYNDWPLMAGRLIPEQLWLPDIGARNFFENTATVQFDHRLLAYATLASTAALHGAAATGPGGMRALPPPVRAGLVAAAALVLGQATLGVTTLMLYVPVELGTAHQAGALALFTGGLYMLHALRRVERAAAAAAAAAAAGAAKPAAAAAALAALAISCGASRTSEEDA